MQYNKVFAKWVNARGAKKQALELELERLNEQIDNKTLPKIKTNDETK